MSVKTRILEVDPYNRMVTYHHYDPDTDETIIEDVQDVEYHIEQNKLLYNNPELHAKTQGKWMASIPPVIQMKWLREKGINVWNKDHQKAVYRLLNDPEWRYLRVQPGRL